MSTEPSVLFLKSSLDEQVVPDHERPEREHERRVWVGIPARRRPAPPGRHGRDRRAQRRWCVHAPTATGTGRPTGANRRLSSNYLGLADATGDDRYEHLAEIRQGRSDRDS